jgi:hypothetical protein
MSISGERSNELFELRGYEASAAVLGKIANPETVLTIGGLMLLRVRDVHHHSDGMVVVESIVPPDTLLTFQYVPNDRMFIETAVNADGIPLDQILGTN